MAPRSGGTVPEFQPQTLLIDFGSGSTTTAKGDAPDDPARYWNNVTDSLAGSAMGQVAGMVTTANEPTEIGLKILSRFNGANANGTTASAPYPADATRDSLYGNTETFGGLQNVFPSFQLTGLNPALAYDLEFYASRTGVSDRRETAYTVTGEKTQKAVLEAANNITNTAVLREVKPNAAGEIAISLAPTAANNNANHFTYLGVLRVSSVAPLAFLTPTVTAEGLRLDWVGGGELESAPTLEGPWTVVSPAGSAYVAPIVPSEARFFRLSRSDEG